MMRVIIAGSRTIRDVALVAEAVAKSGFNVTEVVEGGARGVDTLAFDWAHSQGVPVKVFPADWNRYGKQAGILRNLQMADYADALIAIWDGKSRGTRHMIDVAYKRRMPYRVMLLKEGQSPVFTIDELSVLAQESEHMR